MKKISGSFATATLSLFVVFAVLFSASLAYAAITFGNAQTSTGIGSITITKPTGTATGDLLIAGVVVDAGTATSVTAPSGWTLIRRTDDNDSGQNDSAGDDVSLLSYYKVATASEGANYLWTVSGSQEATGGIIRYTGVNTSNPIDVSAGSSDDGNTASAPSVSTSVVNDMVVVLFGADNDVTFAQPSGTTQRFNVPSSSGDDIAVAADEFTQASIGGTGSKSSSAGTSVNWVSQTIALRPTTFPTVASINRSGTSPTTANSVSWTVNFSQSVTGVDAFDFVLVNTGLGGSPAIDATVTGSGSGPYTVTATTGTGTGTLGLNLIDNDSILGGSTPLGGAGAGNGNSTGQIYSIDRTGPTISFGSPMPAAIADGTPPVSITSNEAGTVSFGGVCDTTSGYTANIISGTVNAEMPIQTEGLRSGCTVSAKDSSGNIGNTLNIPDFVVDVSPPINQTLSYLDGFTEFSAVDLVYTIGTDARTSVSSTTSKIYRRSVLLTNGACANFGSTAYTPVAGADADGDGFYTDTSVQDQRCYQYAFRVNDAAGNLSAETAPGFTVKIDSTPAVLAITSPNANGVSINNTTTSSDITISSSDPLFVGSIVFTRTGGAADANSPQSCSLNGSALAVGSHTINLSDTGNGCVIPVTLVSGTTYSITFSGSNLAGTFAIPASRTGITFDNVAPVTTDNAPTAWTSSDVSVTLSAIDDSGVAPTTRYCFYSASGSACTPTAPGTTVNVTCAPGASCRQIVRYFSTDGTGNAETVKESGVIQIDKLAPVGAGGPGGGGTIGPKSPVTGANVTGIGTSAWQNPGNIVSANDIRAISNVPFNGISNYLSASNFGFNVPANAVITGITATIERHEQYNGGNARVRDEDVLLVTLAPGANATSNDKAISTIWDNASDTTVTYGSASDNWGIVWTPAQVNDASFGLRFAVRNTSSGTAHEVRVDHIQITVTYTILGSSVDAGPDQTKTATFTQTGVATDADSGIATIAWTKDSGPGNVTFGTPGALETTVSVDADGAYVLRLTVTDNAGNSASDTFTLNWDGTAPAVTAVDSDGQTYNGVTVSPHTIKVTFGEDVVTIPSISVGASAQSVNNCSDADAKTWCFAYAIPADTDATTETISVSGAQDAAGNSMTADTAHTFVVDTKAPVSSIVSADDGTNPVAEGGLTKSSTINVSFSAADAGGVASSQCKLDGGSYGPCTSPVTFTGITPDGSHSVSVSSTDNAGNVENTAVFTWNIDATAPTIGDNVDVELPATSADGRTVSFANPPALDFADASVDVSCSPASPFLFPIDVTTVTCTATDDAGNTAQSSFTVTITNNAPVANNQGVSADEDIALPISLTATDIEEFVLSYEVVVQPEHGDLSGTGSELTYTPDLNYNGPDSFTFKANDGDSDSNIATVTISVDAVNDTPTAANIIEDQAASEDIAFSFTVPANTFADVEDASLELSASTLPTWLSFNPTTGEFSGTPAQTDVSEFDITVTATDSGTLSISDTFHMTVSAINDAPVAGDDTDSVDEDDSVATIVLTNDSDVDNASLTPEVVDQPLHGTASVNPNGSITYTSTADYNGSDSYTYKVYDGELYSNTATVSLTVNSINDAPELAAIGEKSVDELSALTFSISAADTNDSPANAVTYSSADLPIGATLDTNTGTFSWTPSESQQGEHEVTFTATDDGAPNLADSEVVTITVGEVNAAPVLAPVGPQSIDEENELRFTVSATDPNDTPANNIAYSSPDLPVGATLNPSTGEFRWTPDESQQGGYPVTIVATDDGSPAANDSEVITITVNEVNDVPVLDAIGPKSVTEGSLLSFTATATDADVPADALTFTLGGTVPAGASITSDGAFTWTPTEAQGPDVYTFDVVVSDGTDSDSESITVTVGEASTAPELGTIDAQSVDEETLLTFTASATDADLPAETLTFTLGGTIPAGAEITAAGVFTWTPTEAQGPETYAFDVIVSDGALTDSQSVSVTVGEVNIAPTFSSSPFTSATEDALYTYSIATGDVDNGDTRTISAPTLPAWLALTDNLDGTASLAGTPTNAEVGDNTVVLEVKDAAGETALQSFTIAVSNTNDAPAFTSTAVTEASEDAPYTYSITASDDDSGDTLAITSEILPGFLSLTDNGDGTATLTGTPVNGDVGPHEIALHVSDGDSTIDQAFTVTVANTNDAPVAVDDSATTDSNVAVEVILNASDVDAGDTLTYSASNGAHGTVVVTGNSAAYTPEADYSGVDAFTFKANDGIADSNEATISVTVNDKVVPPAPTIDTKPSDPTNSTTAAFTFSDTELTTSFECKLDAELEFTNCDSGVSYLSLSEGEHTFSVRAKDTADNVSSGTSYSWTIDTTGPVVSVDSPADAATVSPAGSIAYSVGDSATVACTLDTVEVACSLSGPYDFSALADGSHTFAVTGTDAANNSTSDSVTFIVDATGPVVTIEDGPADLSTIEVRDGAFTFSSADAVAYTCTLDAVESSCTSPAGFAGLADGPHTFSVVGVDALGNSGAPASRTFTVDATAPVLSGETAGTFTTTSATITWTTDHPATSRVLWGSVTNDPVSGTAPNYGYLNSTDEDTTLVTEHSVTVIGLAPETPYFFRPVSHGSPEAVGIEVSGSTLAEVVIPNPACSNGTDDDGDTLVDMLDSGCTGPSDDSELNVIVEPGTGSLVVNKVVDNTAGGSKVASQFSYQLDGEVGIFFESVDATHGTKTQTVDTGAHTVVEVGANTGSYVTTYGGDCDSSGHVSVSDGQSKTCTITNTYSTVALPEDGSLKVVKHAVGGSLFHSFTFSGNAGSFTIFTFLGYGSKTINHLPPGTYTVTENAKSGWTKTSNTCSNVEVVAGQTATCSFTNTKNVAETGKLKVVKKTINGNGKFFFEIYDEETDNVADVSIKTWFGKGSKTVSNLVPGTYSVTEAPKVGWTETSNSCVDVEVTAGHTTTCVITNTKDSGDDENEDPETGKIVVQKVTMPSGETADFDFTASYDADGFALSDGEQNVADLLPAGSYSVSENDSDGWTSDGGVCASSVDEKTQTAGDISLEAGETVTCVFTNTKAEASTTGTIVVKKATDPTGDTTNFTFNASYEATTFALADGEQHVASNLPEGVYSVSEATLPQDWSQLSAVCDDGSTVDSIQLSAGETVTCTFTNKKSAGVTPPAPPAAPSGGGGGGGGSNGPIFGSFGGSSFLPQGQVLGASTSGTLPELPSGCSALLSGFMRKGKANDLSEVKKLQKFLNDQLQSGLPITGFFGPLTDGAVKKFQSAHFDEVLKPWGIDAPTGYVYKTTQRWINLTQCSGLEIPMPVLE